MIPVINLLWIIPASMILGAVVIVVSFGIMLNMASSEAYAGDQEEAKE